MIFHVKVREINEGFLEIKAKTSEEALQIADNVLTEQVDPGIHWVKEELTIEGVEEFPEEWLGVDPGYF